MNARPLATVLIAMLMLVGSLAGLTDNTVAADPIKATQMHIVTFSDGSSEVVGMTSALSHMVTEVTVPAGGRVLSASLNVSRVRYETSEILLDSAPRAVWSGDLDRDGMDDDVLVAFPDAGRLDIYTLEGDPPTLVRRLSLDVPDATSVAVDDLDRDNDKDVIVTSGSLGRVYVFEALAVDIFAEPRVIPVGPRPGAIAVKDLDPDFRRDIVVANSGGSSVTVLQGRGDLGFYPRTDEMGKGPSAIHLRDMDKDLDVDLVVAESRNDTVSVWYNEGNGNFTNATVLPTGIGPVDIDVRDLNGDSLIDVAVACAGSDQVWVYNQLEDGNFSISEVLAVGKAPRVVLGAQANELQDRNMDIVTACSGSDNLTVYLAGGDLRHTIPVDIPVGGRPVAVGIVDGSGVQPDKMVVACQMPPALVIVNPVQVADLISVGLGRGGSEGEVTLPQGLDHATVLLTGAFSSYVLAHSDEDMYGNLQVRIEAWAGQAGVLRLSDVDVWVQRNRVPRADAGRNVTVLVGEPAELNGSSSYDADGGFLEFLWFLDDDDPIQTDRVSYYVFNEPGEYHIFLVVRDIWGLEDFDQVTVMVNAPPKAKGVVPEIVTARESTRLSAYLSEDPDGIIVDYIWDYSQGVVHGETVDVLFTGTGTVNVTLQVIDDDGARATALYEVEILPATTPLREPAEQIPEDRGEVPGPGALVTMLTLLGAAGIAAARRRWH
jgi:hypothetical protein